MGKEFIFSSESVGEGHPDKVADYISDTILDACLEEDPHSRVACETMVKRNCVFLAGEITTQADIDYDSVVRQAIREIGYTHDDDIFHADKVFITNALTKQSPDIAQGVDIGTHDGKMSNEQGAGDQGIMFGYACNGTSQLMPLPIMLAHNLNKELAKQRSSGKAEWLRPDCKSQVAVHYIDNKPVGIRNIVISTQHTEDVSHKEIKEFCIEEVIKKVVPQEFLKDQTQYFINPTGRFVLGGPDGDAGVTGRKIIVDSYGGWARHGGGAFSGKDPSKVDRSAAYMCRWVAKNIVAAGIADEVELQIAYAIGYPNPTSINVKTFGSSHYSDEHIEETIKKVFNFKPAAIIEQLNLLQPFYRQTTNYGHFTHQELPWEQVSKINEFKAALEINGVMSSR